MTKKIDYNTHTHTKSVCDTEAATARRAQLSPSLDGSEFATDRLKIAFACDM